MNFTYFENQDIERASAVIDKLKILEAFRENEVPAEDLAFLDTFKELVELELMLNWNSQLSKPEADQDNFKKLSKHLYDIFSLTNPDFIDKNDEIKHYLKLASYAYIGEHGEKTRKVAADLLLDSPVSNDYSSLWPERVIQKIYIAFLHILRKEGWSDLSDTIAIINSLRSEQEIYEKEYLNAATDSDTESTGSALELASLYHLAKAIEIVADFQLDGRPSNAAEEVSLQIDYAVQYSKKGGLVELTLLLKIVEVCFQKIINNSIWIVGQRINSRVTKFLNSMKNRKPMLELLYPQKDAILNQGLLDPAHSAIIVNLPTSSGKTLVAEFKILQSLNQFDNAWVAYVAPTKALVNQITRRLRSELGQEPLSLRVESMSGALDVDSYEQAMIDGSQFDILVTTPEKLNLLIRRGLETALDRPLALAVIDEAHNISSETRGINLELLLSNIRHDCANANILLLTPFIPNSDEIAKWLSPESSRSISLSLDWWKPNDQLIGAVSLGEVKQRQSVETKFKPLITSRHTLQVDDIYSIGTSATPHTRGELKSNYKISALAAHQFSPSTDKLIIARTVDETYKIADELVALSDSSSQSASSEIDTIRKFIASELGADFPLVGYLSKGIGVHHSALPDEIKSMMEYLMEKRQLRYLVATTTIAQGINFDTPSIFMASYSYPYMSGMPYFDFWNLVGRSGRLYQKDIGVVGIACKSEEDIVKLKNYLSQGATEIVSNLKGMVETALQRGGELDLERLYSIPEWSNFLQYIAHMYNQAQNLRTFETQIQLTMRRTLGYQQLDQQTQEVLLESVRKYARKLDANPGVSTLSDLTGFSPETIARTMAMSSSNGLSLSDWDKSSLFAKNSSSMQKLVNMMLNIPEIKKDLQELIGDSVFLSEGKIANMISDWVGGKTMNQMAAEYFTDIADPTKRLTQCVKAVHRYLVNSSTWGLSAIQSSASGIDFDALSSDERRKLSDLPAMVYYGVDSSEAIALRKLRVPRSMSSLLSARLKNEFGEELYSKSGSEIEQWLKSLDSVHWQTGQSGPMSGIENKKIWEILSVT